MWRAVSNLVSICFAVGVDVLLARAGNKQNTFFQFTFSGSQKRIKLLVISVIYSVFGTIYCFRQLRFIKVAWKRLDNPAVYLNST